MFLRLPRLVRTHHSPHWHLLAAISKEEGKSQDLISKWIFHFSSKRFDPFDARTGYRISLYYYNFQIRYDSPSWKELNADRLVTIANHRFVCRLDPSKFYLNFPIIYVEKFSTLIQRKMEQWRRTFMSTYEVEAFQCKWTYQEFSGECSFLLNRRREECVETSEKRRGME